MFIYLFIFNKKLVVDYLTDIMNFMSKYDKKQKKTSFLEVIFENL